MRRDEGTLLDVARAMRLAMEFAGDLDAGQLRTDALVFSAVQHQLLVLGEAVKRLSPSFVESHPELPWSDMAGLRDRLIHRYDEVDPELVWRALHLELPGLLASVERLLPDAT